MAERLRIAIDGSAASGKTTVARLLAHRLGLLYLDTGAMYRALTWKARRQRISLHDAEALGRMAACTELVVRPRAGAVSLEVDGQEVRDDLYTPEISRDTALVAKASGVRQEMVRLQQQQAAHRDVVMVGRDIGTVVLPQAELKIFVVADLAERARRRWEELGRGLPLAEVERELAERDRQDEEREDSPLEAAPDAHRIDTTDLTPEQVVQRILVFLDRGAGPP